MPRKGGKRVRALPPAIPTRHDVALCAQKKRRTHVPASADGERVKVPETFVMRRGKASATRA